MSTLIKKIFVIPIMIAVMLALAGLYAQESLREYRKRILECIVATPPYDYMFLNQDFPKQSSIKTISLYGVSFGEYTGGTQGAMFYSGFVQCVSDVEKQSSGDSIKWGSLAPLEKKTGLPASLRTEPFLSINPLIIKALARIYIPSPDEKLDGKKMQEIYNIVFRRGARLMTESYLLITRNMSFEKEQLRYARAQIQTSDFDAQRYLYKKYATKLSSYRYKMRRTWGLLQPEHALGFWLRRGLDGSADVIFTELARVMQKYDGAWLQKTKDRYLKKKQ